MSPYSEARTFVTNTFKHFRNDKSMLLFFIAVTLDFVFTTVGLVVIGPELEANPLYRTPWEKGQYLTYLDNWLLVGFGGWIVIMFILAAVKDRCLELGRVRPNRERVSRILELGITIVIIYLSLDRLYSGAIGWAIGMACNSFSAVNACITYTSSSPVFAILNLIFPSL